jgi:shikimate dehydrogenase
VTKAPAACLIGWPAAHSRSPLIHHYWLRTLGIEGGYVVEAVPLFLFCNSIDEYA